MSTNRAAIVESTDTQSAPAGSTESPESAGSRTKEITTGAAHAQEQPARTDGPRDCRRPVDPVWRALFEALRNSPASRDAVAIPADADDEPLTEALYRMRGR
ncbi:hypothetical protein TW95_gp0120 [Pandoravirus inopinatum]|uniref:Uncharacterized protein n=1 Tax=Pandoravirus inopinatum TaxID=1605721 RepID=A0A0B5J087_9VIRU|nr:hypothetical protein TW95_gp0120 [Pandoravirus inopinatum]AJF96854.1 hypothetical protein [Pandoravirus inopinatum]